MGAYLLGKDKCDSAYYSVNKLVCQIQTFCGCTSTSKADFRNWEKELSFEISKALTWPRLGGKWSKFKPKILNLVPQMFDETSASLLTSGKMLM